MKHARLDPSASGARPSRRRWLVRAALAVGGGLAAWSAWGKIASTGESNQKATPTGRPEEKKMDFNRVTVGDHVSNPCSPEIPDDFIGIRINAPAKVVHNVDRFVICGTFRFLAEYMQGFGSILHSVALVAVDARTHRPRVCTTMPPGFTPRPGKPPNAKDPTWMEDHRIQKFFNVDLMVLMPDLPKRTADYYIYALIEDHLSNVVRVSFRA